MKKLRTPWETFGEKGCTIFHSFAKKESLKKKKFDLSGGTGIKDFPGGTRGKEPTCQCKRQVMRVWSLGWENPLEEDSRQEHSSVLAWRIPWTEEPGRSQRIRHDWSNLVCTGIKTVMIMEKSHSAMQIEFSLSLYSILIKSEKWSRSVVSDSMIPWTVAHQAPPSMELSRQKYWSGLPFPSPGDLPDPGIEPDRHFTVWATWEAAYIHLKRYDILLF